MSTTATATRQLITNSRRQSYHTCPRKAFYEYELGIRKDNPAKTLRFGDNVHDALDELAMGATLQTACDRITERYAEIPAWCLDDETVTEWFVEAETCLALVRGYAWRWQLDTATVVATEQSFRVPLVNPKTGACSQIFELGGKIDKIIARDSRLGIREHKTTSEAIDSGSDYWKRLRLDRQISLYTIAARQMGYDVDFVEYDVIKKPGIKPRTIKKGQQRDWLESGQWFGVHFDYDPEVTRETPAMFGARLLADIYQRPDFYYARKEIPRLDSDLEEAATELWHFQQILRTSQRSNLWPRNTQACLKPYRCPFTDLCFNQINPTEEYTPEGYVRLDHIHPEIEETV